MNKARRSVCVLTVGGLGVPSFALILSALWRLKKRRRTMFEVYKNINNGTTQTDIIVEMSSWARLTSRTTSAIYRINL